MAAAAYPSFIDKYRKALIGLVPMAAAVLALAGVHFDTTAARVIVGFVLLGVGPVVYFVGNLHDLNPPKATKALAALGASVVGVGMVFHVDLSAQVTHVVAAFGSVSPFLIAWLDNH